MSEHVHTEPFDKEISRRSFLKGFGTVVVATAAVPIGAVAAGTEEIAKLGADQTLGPGQVPVSLNVNGKALKLNLEPRVTLLDALRNYSSLTGTKEVCDRATCGACTVLFDGKPIYSCMKLAIEAQGHGITTVEGLGDGWQAHQCATGGGRERRVDVRLLHARFRYDRDLTSETQSTPDRRRSACRMFRQHLPMRHATSHTCGGASCGRGTRRGNNRGHSGCVVGPQNQMWSAQAQRASTPPRRSPARRNIRPMYSPADGCMA